MSYQGAQNHSKMRNRDRASATLIGDFPTPHSSIADDPLLNYSTNRYPTMPSSRANSLTTQRMDEFTGIGFNPHSSNQSRRASANPSYGQPFPQSIGPAKIGPK